LTAYHAGLAEALQLSLFGYCFVPEQQWDRVPPRPVLGSWRGALIQCVGDAVAPPRHRA
jgi:hypothetical protein